MDFLESAERFSKAAELFRSKGEDTLARIAELEAEVMILKNTLQVRPPTFLSDEDFFERLFIQLFGP